MRNIQLSKMDVKLLLILSQMAEPRVEMRISFFLDKQVWRQFKIQMGMYADITFKYLYSIIFFTFFGNTIEKPKKMK